MRRMKKYLLMQLKFKRCKEYGYENCGIDKDDIHYQPKLIEKFSLEDGDYIDYLVELIKLNDSVKGRKYDTMYYLVEGSFYYGQDKKKFMSREHQETLMEDFFDTDEYILALGKSEVLKGVKPNKLSNNIHIKYSNLIQPYHFTKLGIYRLDPMTLDDIKESIDSLMFEDSTFAEENKHTDKKDSEKPSEEEKAKSSVGWPSDTKEEPQDDEIDVDADTDADAAKDAEPESKDESKNDAEADKE